jgi:hypothetical protein
VADIARAQWVQATQHAQARELTEEHAVALLAKLLASATTVDQFFEACAFGLASVHTTVQRPQQHGKHEAHFPFSLFNK